MSFRTIRFDQGDGTTMKTGTSANDPQRSLVPPLATWGGTVRSAWQRNKGPGLVVLAQFFAALMNVTTRLLETESGGMQTLQVLLARMGITSALCSAYMWWANTEGFPLGDKKIRMLLHIRGISGFISVFGLYYSLQYLPLAEATVLTFLAPTVSCWACAILIHEPFTRKEQIAGLLSLVGVGFIARPVSWLPHGMSSAPTDNLMRDKVFPLEPRQPNQHVMEDEITSNQRLTAVGVGLLGVMGAASAFTTIRWIGKRAPPMLSVNYFATWTTLVSAVVLLLYPGIDFQLPATLREWGLLFFLGVSGFIMQILFTTGMQQEKNSRATSMVYTQMIFAVLFDKLVWNSTMSVWSVIGSSIILTGAIYIAMHNYSRASMAKNFDRREDEEERLLCSGDSSSIDESPTERDDLRNERLGRSQDVRT